MTVDPTRAAGHVEHEGTTYYFCSKGCVAKFSADPKKYLAGAREAMAPAVIQLGGLGTHTLFPIGSTTGKPIAPSAILDAEAYRLADLGVDWIETDDPERLMRLLS